MHRRDFLRNTAFAGGLWVLGEAEGLTIPLQQPDNRKWPDNRYLQGNFAPVHEEVTVDHLQIIGKLPAELDGLFVRNGPNPQFPPIQNYHWFEGDGMLHGVRVRDGKASYRNRYVRTDGWRQENKAGKATYHSFLDPPDAKRMQSGPSAFKNAASTALIWHNGRLFALYEAGPPHEIQVPSLDTVGVQNFGEKLKHPFTAHPKVDPKTGEMMCFGYTPWMKPYLQYTVINPQGQIVKTTPIDLPRGVMMHDFAITEKHTIFMDLPETFSMEKAMRGQPPFQFQPELGSRFGILPRHGDGKDVKWFSSPACFVFHVLNAYEEGDEVVLLACRMKEFPQGVAFDPAATKHPTDGKSLEVNAVLYRWRFNLKTGLTKEEALDDRGTEFPRVNEQLTGRPTRYGYCGTEEGDFFGGIVKYDLHKGSSTTCSYGKNRFGGEAVFVPRPGGREEDDGWLVTYVHDMTDGKSEMFVADARDLTAPPIARLLLPQRVPYGFHGAWIEGKAL